MWCQTKVRERKEKCVVERTDAENNQAVVYTPEGSYTLRKRMEEEGNVGR